MIGLISNCLMYIFILMPETRKQNSIHLPGTIFPRFPIFRNFISIYATEILKGFFDSSLPAWLEWQFIPVCLGRFQFIPAISSPLLIEVSFTLKSVMMWVINYMIILIMLGTQSTSQLSSVLIFHSVLCSTGIFFLPFWTMSTVSLRISKWPLKWSS